MVGRGLPSQMVGRGPRRAQSRRLLSLKPRTAQRLICPARGTSSPYHFTCLPPDSLQPRRHGKPNGRARFANFLSGAERLLLVSLFISILEFLAQPGAARQPGPDASFNAAVQAFNAGKLEDAERLADAAEEANPKRPDIRNLRGAILARQKRYDQAVEQFNAALTIDPNFYQAKLNLAEVNLHQGKYAEAAQHYEELQKIDPESELLQFKLILCALLSGNAVRASMMADIMKFPGKTPAYYYARAAIALKRGNKESAQKYFGNVGKYYSEEQCTYFAQSLKDLDLIDPNSTEQPKSQGQPAKKTDEN
jgi:tetratricopeptide (TPR) repeat protein